jgi:hypothetical protein
MEQKAINQTRKNKERNRQREPSKLIRNKRRNKMWMQRKIEMQTTRQHPFKLLQNVAAVQRSKLLLSILYNTV